MREFVVRGNYVCSVCVSVVCVFLVYVCLGFVVFVNMFVV